MVNFEQISTIVMVFSLLISRPATPGEPGAMPSPPPPTFLHSKKKIRKQRGKRKNSKAETIKRLPPRLKCYCFSHSRAFRIQKFFLSANHGGRQYFPLFHGPSTLRSISPTLNLNKDV